MFKLKKQFKNIYLCLITVIGLLFIFNNHQVMALKNENICNRNMKINNIFVEKEEDILSYIIRKNIYQSFSYLTLDYPCYNGDNNKYDICWCIKNPPHDLLFVAFDKGTRYKNDYIYTLEELKNLGNGAENLYIFWLKKSICNINKEIFYQLEIKFKEIEIEKLNIKLNLSKENESKREKEIQQIQREITKNENNNKALINQLNVEQNKIKELKAKIKTLKNDEIQIQEIIKQKDEEIVQLKEKIQEQSEEILKLIVEIKTKTEILKQQIEIIKQLEGKIVVLEGANSILVTKNKELEFEINKIKNQLTKEEENYEEIKLVLEQNKIESLNQQNNIKKLQKELNQKTNSYMGIFNSLYKKIF
ncbi:MAG: SVM family protein ['Conium maculatum' witches'-broom phytoplasma]|nr:SVM family protein ['Conium maculatum' witches'-broom phytoplasma]